MNKEIKKKWVEALRSGEYEQGQLRLRIGDKYCCLGVLCDIIDPDGWNVYNEHRGRVELPHLDLRDVHEIGIRDLRKLTKFNDTCNWSFDEIAHYVEKNL